MKSIAIVVLLLVFPPAAAGAAPSAASPAQTVVDPCTLQQQGYSISSGQGCLQITGGVSVMESWGNTRGGWGSDASGQPVVRTPAGDYDIPSPR
jgi:hypothetical protein